MKTTESVQEATCPSCGRFVGAYETCPYCRASMETRLSLKWVRLISIFGSVIGLILLWFGVRYKEVPLVKIGAIDLQYNMAIARLEGYVIDVKENPAKNSFRITLDDGTGRAHLGGYGKLALFKKVLGDDFPRLGDKISAVGNLSVSESWGVTMFLATPRRLKRLSRAGKLELKLDRAVMENAGRIAVFHGKITGVRSFSKGRTLTLQDDSGTANLTIFNSELKNLPPETAGSLDEEGTELRFLGRIDTWHNRVQLRLVEPDKSGNLQIIHRKAGDK